MTLEETLRNGLQRLVGGVEVWQWPAPRAAVSPFVTMRRLRHQRGTTLDGARIPGPVPFELSVWSDNWDASVELCKTIADALEGFRDSMVLGTFVRGQFDNYDPDNDVRGRTLEIDVLTTEE